MQATSVACVFLPVSAPCMRIVTQMVDEHEKDSTVDADWRRELQDHTRPMTSQSQPPKMSSKLTSDSAPDFTKGSQLLPETQTQTKSSPINNYSIDPTS